MKSEVLLAAFKSPSQILTKMEVKAFPFSRNNIYSLSFLLTEISCLQPKEVVSNFKPSAISY